MPDFVDILPTQSCVVWVYSGRESPSHLWVLIAGENANGSLLPLPRFQQGRCAHKPTLVRRIVSCDGRSSPVYLWWQLNLRAVAASWHRRTHLSSLPPVSDQPAPLLSNSNFILPRSQERMVDKKLWDLASVQG